MEKYQIKILKIDHKEKKMCILTIKNKEVKKTLKL